MMRRALWIIVLLSASGCIQSKLAAPTTDAPILAAGWSLDCGVGRGGSYDETAASSTHSRAPTSENARGGGLGAAEKAQNASWPHPCVARASHAPGHKQEIWLAANPMNAENVVIGSKDLNPASSMKCVWNGLAVTKDGGKTWKDVTIGGAYANRTPGSPYFGYACNTDPMLAFTKDGAVHYVVEMYNFGGQDGYGPLPPDPRNGRGIVQPGWDLVLATSTDGGLTWPTVTDLLRGDGVGVENDYSRMVVSPKTGTILVMINTFRGIGSQGVLPQVDSKSQYNSCSVIASHDGGKTADAPVEALAPDTLSDGADCRTISAAPDGTLVILGEKGDQVWSMASTDDGKTWGAPVFASWKKQAIMSPFNESKYRTGTNMEAAFDAKGTLFVMYADKSRDEADEWVRSSTDKGKTWTDAVLINQDAPGSHQFMGNFAPAKDGSLHAFYFDTSHDPANKLIDITHAISTDDGRTWTTERVTNVSWDADLGKHQEGFPFIGDYIGVDASGDSVWAGFPDTTPGISVIAAARVHRG